MFVLSALVLSSFTIAGAQEEDPYADVDPSGQEIVWWHQHSQHREEWLAEKLAEFNAENEWGITITQLMQGGYGDVYDKMGAGIQSGDLPNLVVSYQNQQAFYESADVLFDIDILVNSPTWGLTEEELADFNPGFWGQDVHVMYDNERLGYPTKRSMNFMYYNMDWLNELGYDAPPTTWDEFSTMACEATDAEAGTIGYAFYDSASNLATMVASRGGDIDNGEGGYNLDTQEMQDTLQWLQDLVNAGCAYVPTEDYGDQADFANRKALFTLGSSSGMPYYVSAIEDSELGMFNWGVAPMPAPEGMEPVVNVYGASVSIVDTTPEANLASWLFLKWFTTPEIQAEWLTVSGYFPTRYSTADTEIFQTYLAENLNYAKAFNLLTTSKIYYEPQYLSYEAVRRVMDEASARVVAGEVPADVTVWLQGEVDAIVAEFAE
jgi:multiple sugar transport system substrate-binding protein/sn-glycerol 3-phosphate transport system substrate-binding protein